MDAPYTSGRLSSSIALIGEAPGREEELAGGAFVGSAGRLLNELLHQAGISRSDVYIDNVFQVRPPGNDVSIWLDLRKRNPETPQYQAAKAALLERLALCPANILIPLGNVPLYALTGKVAITKQRGSLLLSEDGRKVLPTIHPSAALREYMLRYLIVADLKRAKGQAASPGLKLLDRTFVLEPSHEEALGFLRQAMSYPTVAYDIETRGLEMSHISVAVSPTQVICIPFLVGNDNYWTPEQELEILYALQDLLEAPGVTKVGQNLSFDATFLYSKYGFITRPFEDTMIAQGILYPDLPKGLDFLTSLYCNGEPYYKDDGKTWMRNPFGSDLAFRRYNAMDSAVLMEIWPQQREELVKGGNFQTYERQRNLLLPLVFAGSRGIRMDLKGLTGAAQTCTQNIEALQKELNELAGEAINANSPKQIQTYFYVKRRLRPHTKDGRVTTDDKALRMIAAAGHKEAQLILDLRHEQKMLSTYYGVQLDPDGRLRCSFNPVGTAQGRVSSSKTIRGTGMNLQNQPEDMNALMIADPGYILVNQDLGQAENRVVAYVAGEPMMMQAFEHGVDIHKQTASLIHGVMIEDVTPDQRQDGKTANHGLNYDEGPDGFARIHLLPLQKARFIYTRYHEVYPGIHEWHQTVRSTLAEKGRTLTNCFGRRRTFMDRWGPDLFKVAYSYIPQSTVADLMNQAGYTYLYYRQDLFPEVVFLNTIHDSIRYEIPLEAGIPRILEIVGLLKKSLEATLTWQGREFSIPVDTAFGFTFDKKKMMEWKASKVAATAPEALEGELSDYVEKNRRLD